MALIKDFLIINHKVNQSCGYCKDISSKRKQDKEHELLEKVEKEVAINFNTPCENL